ncbi:MAG: hypothetical protein JNG86_22425 [Verrucomicrobiaceae bacterium]|nr:hypothetical protein [Verrucomicrobiaceae bacterium]
MNDEGIPNPDFPNDGRLKWKLAVLAVIAAVVALFWWWLISERSKPSGHGVQDTLTAAAKVMEGAARLQMAAPLPGASILQNYASTSTRPEDDLHAMAHVFSNLRLLLKGDAPFRMGANEEFAAALLGKNAAKEVFLSAPHACLNEKGQIIDRWGTALFFHVRDAQRIDIRSAGPDRTMWTADDLHRTHEGEFVHGGKLPEHGRR